MHRFDMGVLGKSMRIERARNKMTQSDLAMAIGVASATVSAYERGLMMPSVEKIHAMSEALGCTPNDLMGWKEAG